MSPLMPLLPQRRDDRQLIQACPSRNPGPDESIINPVLTPEELPPELSPQPHCSSTQAPTSRPFGLYAVGLRPSLDRAPMSTCAQLAAPAQI